MNEKLKQLEEYKGNLVRIQEERNNDQEQSAQEVLQMTAMEKEEET